MEIEPDTTLWRWCSNKDVFSFHFSSMSFSLPCHLLFLINKLLDSRLFLIVLIFLFYAFAAKEVQKIIRELCPIGVQKLLEEDEKVGCISTHSINMKLTKMWGHPWCSYLLIIIIIFLCNLSLDQVNGETMSLCKQLQTM